MTPEEIAYNSIATIVDKMRKPVIITGTATEIDKAKQTCTIEREGEAPLLGVKLATVIGVDGQAIVIVPKANSVVIAAMIEKSDMKAILISCQEIDELLVTIKKVTIKVSDTLIVDCSKIVFNEGENGMVQIDKLTAKINGLKDSLNDLIAKFNAHTHIVTIASLATPTPSAPVVAPATPAMPLNKSDYEDTKIKH